MWPSVFDQAAVAETRKPLTAGPPARVSRSSMPMPGSLSGNEDSFEPTTAAGAPTPPCPPGRPIVGVEGQTGNGASAGAHASRSLGYEKTREARATACGDDAHLVDPAAAAHDEAGGHGLGEHAERCLGKEVIAPGEAIRPLGLSPAGKSGAIPERSLVDGETRDRRIGPPVQDAGSAGPWTRRR